MIEKDKGCDFIKSHSLWAYLELLFANSKCTIKTTTVKTEIVISASGWTGVFRHQFERSIPIHAPPTKDNVLLKAVFIIFYLLLITRRFAPPKVLLFQRCNKLLLIYYTVFTNRNQLWMGKSS